MDIKELRIGNIIKSNGKLYRLHGIKAGKWGLDAENIETGELMAITCEHAKPIALAKDLLPRIGLVYSPVLRLFGEDGGHTIFECNDEDEESCCYTIHFYHNGNHLIIESSNEHGEYSNLKFQHIKYLHQYQNLYFDMTNKELELKKEASND